ncbi:copper amine oxidase N-terminal domain-containing protein [Ammoniphilus sp. CFH 90114]|uniref:copper amine oxidase N-terminal domain-containing protein n=1 Tax=Ammoniphilus sp. CFH 90114 TaxID=2493665 RepID=UPI00100ED2DE|nr:copper amine oxidase N-terminal domain-containing protein [Ammoniphilus sp. CFH 90114]RXT06978.1 copper amine oxidase N-terminal domain-containing protein [Ammoniphilus sp. CFH 90114]
MKLKKLAMAVGLIAIVASTPMVTHAVSEIRAKLAPHIKITNEGNLIDTSAATPIIYNGTTYVPLRKVGEALGYDVTWNGESSTVQIKKPDEAYPLYKVEGIEVVSLTAFPDAFKGVTGTVFGRYDVNVSFNITKELNRKPIFTLEVLDKNKNVVSATVITVQRTKPDTWTHPLVFDNFVMANVQDVETANELLRTSYTYRIKIE